MDDEKTWEMRFIACEPRLSEAVAAYKEAGFEVRLERPSEIPDCTGCTRNENHHECKACFEDIKDKYKAIFTRPVKGASPRE